MTTARSRTTSAALTDTEANTMGEKNGEDRDILRDNRIIYLKGDIDEEQVHSVVGKLLEYECDDPSRDILMFIDSYGGYVDSFIGIHDAMKMCRCSVATCCIGKAMSAAQMILISGEKDKRFITPLSTVMMHQLSTWTDGKLKDVENDLVHSRRQQDIMNTLAAKYTNLTKKQVKDFMDKDTYLSAEESLEYGFIDKIVKKPSDLYSAIQI